MSNPAPPVSTGVQATAAAAQADAVRQTLENLAVELGLEVPDVAPPSGEQTTATVVVVGEPKNGKSTLVNALVGRPGLSPVDYAVTTATYIAISYGTPGVRVWPEGADGPEEVHLDELPAWTSVTGLADNPRAPRIARPVEVTLPAPILERISLVDTPGVGGFDGSHDRATVAAFEGATALLFCADGSRPMSDPELRFLEVATERIAQVTFALTKVDENGDWRDVLADNQAALAKHAPLYKDAPWFPVAAPLAERALEPGVAPELVEAFRERSGVGALAGHLTSHVAERAEVLVAASTIKSLQSVADHFKVVAEERVAQITDPPEETGARLADEKQQLESLRSREDEWRTGLELELSNLRTTELNGLDRTLTAIQTEATAAAGNTKVSAEQIGAAVNDALAKASADISERVAAKIDERIADIVGDQADSPAFAMAMQAALHSAEAIELRAGRDLVAEGRLQPAQTLPLLMSGTGAFMISSSIVGLTAPTAAGAVAAGTAGIATMMVAFAPVGIALAATAAAFTFAKRQASINERKQWVQARLTESRTDLQTVIDQRVTNARVLAARAVREWIRIRGAELTASIEALATQQRSDGESRTRAVRDAKARVDNLDRLIRTCDGYIKQWLEFSATTLKASS